MPRALPLALLAAALLVPASSALAAKRGYRAEIRRTTGGIPHVKARDYGSLGYGYGYAYAQDQLCEFANIVVTVGAQRSRYFGAEARVAQRRARTCSRTSSGSASTTRARSSGSPSAARRTDRPGRCAAP